MGLENPLIVAGHHFYYLSTCPFWLLLTSQKLVSLWAFAWLCSLRLCFLILHEACCPLLVWRVYTHSTVYEVTHFLGSLTILYCICAASTTLWPNIKCFFFWFIILSSPLDHNPHDVRTLSSSCCVQGTQHGTSTKQRLSTSLLNGWMNDINSTEVGQVLHTDWTKFVGRKERIGGLVGSNLWPLHWQMNSYPLCH